MKTALFPGSAESQSLAAEYGYDDWLVNRFLRYVPDTHNFLATMERQPARYLRVNELKISKSDLRARLESKGFELESTVLPEVFLVKRSPMSIGATTEYMLGQYYLQDLSSCLAVDALDVGPDQTILDIAAAPGGKTTFIAQRMKNTGSVIALEPNERRARSMTFNLARCGVSNTAVFRLDGRDAERLGTKFDRVLLDAPCSCEGVIPKDATRKTSHSPGDVEYCSNRQEKLVESAARLVKPGGVLVYATCSFAPEENEMVVESLLHSGRISVEPIPYGSEGLTRFDDREFNAQLKNSRRLYPHLHNTTGFFIAKLRIN